MFPDKMENLPVKADGDRQTGGYRRKIPSACPYGLTCFFPVDAEKTKPVQSIDSPEKFIYNLGKEYDQKKDIDKREAEVREDMNSDT